MFKDLDSKTITSAGGIILAGILAYGLIQLSTGRVDSLVEAMVENTKAIREGNSQISAAILEQAKQVQANTSAIHTLSNSLR